MNDIVQPNSDARCKVPLGSILRHHASKTPGRIAIIADGLRLAYDELDARANRRARVLLQHGVHPDDLVTIAMANCIEFYETTFAIWKLGAIPNVISSKCARPEMAAILDLVRPKLFIGNDPPAGFEFATLPTGMAIDEQLSSEPLREIVSPHWKAMTSGGSTGRPKVILDAAPGLWDPTAGFLCQEPGDILLNPGPLYHNAPFCCIHTGLFTGGTVVEMGKFDAVSALELIDTHRVNWVTMVPTMMHRIWRLGSDRLSQFDLSSLRVMLHMAAPCSAWLKEAWISWLGRERLLEYYGTTEGLGSTIISGTEWLTHRGSVGRVRPGSELAILDDRLNQCAVGEIGEIYFLPDGGAGSTYRYIGSETKRVGQWESTGDLGWIDSEEYLYLSDRRNDLIISGGSNIYPAEVEAAIDEHSFVRTSAVIGLPDEEWGARVHAIVQLVPSAKLEQSDLLAFLSERLARYKLPKTFEFTGEPLRDEAGKLRRVALRDARAAQRALNETAS